jgi:hypothetical protein
MFLFVYTGNEMLFMFMNTHIFIDTEFLEGNLRNRLQNYPGGALRVTDREAFIFHSIHMYLSHELLTDISYRACKLSEPCCLENYISHLASGNLKLPC